MEMLPIKQDVDSGNDYVGDKISGDEYFWEEQSLNSALSLGYNLAIDECQQAMDKAVEKASNIKKLDRIIYENGHRTIEEMAQAISTYIKSCFNGKE